MTGAYIEPPHDKTNKMTCAQRRLRSACASAQSDQRLPCPHDDTLGPQLPTEHPAKTLIRLGGFPGGSESWLSAHAISFVLSWGGSYIYNTLKTYVSGKTDPVLSGSLLQPGWLILMTIVDIVRLCSLQSIINNDIRGLWTIDRKYLYQGISDISLESSCFSKALLNHRCHSLLILNWWDK